MPHKCCKHDAEAGLSSIDFASSAAVNQYAPDLVIQPTHLDISLKFGDLNQNSVHARVTLTLKHGSEALITNAELLSHLVLNTEDFGELQVSGDRGLSHSYDGHHIQLHWQVPFEIGEERQVVVDYKLDHPVAGLYFQRQDSIMGNATVQWAITDHETEKARYWLPTVDYPAVRTTLSWTISAPSKYTSLANGRLVGEETKDGITTTRWKLDSHPCPSYLVCFAVGEFITVDAGSACGRPVKYFTAKGYEAVDLERAFDRTPEMMKWLESKVGVPFPWPKYYQIALPAIRGAMENISLVTWIDTFIQDSVLTKELKYLTDLVNVHEMAHTYFGDLLVIRHFEHAWLKESWATYMEACWAEDKMFPEDFQYELFVNAKAYIRECSRYMRPIVTRKYDSSWDVFDSHTYPGGAWRIHMLRKKLGDKAFWTGVRNYVLKYSTCTVETGDFQKSLENASGLNLTRFFDEWLLSKGYPKLSGTYEYDLAKQGVTITMRQTQAKDGDIPLFAFDLEIELIDDRGQTYNVCLSFDREPSAAAFIKLQDGASPCCLRVDPDNKVLYSLEMSADQQVLQNTAKSAKDIKSRIWAYDELIKNGSWYSLQTVKQHILAEPFYGVRVQVAGLLKKTKSVLGLEILADMLRKEQDPMAMASVAVACQIQNELIRKAVLDFLARPGVLPYRAHAEALVALAVQRNPQDLDYLLQVAKDDTKLGQHGIVRGGALKALGYHRSEEAFRYLIERVGYNIEPVRARPHAIAGLQYSAEWQEKRIKKRAIEALTNLLCDPDHNVRVQAVEALVALQEKSVYTEIDSSRHMYSNDDRPWLDRKLSELLEGGATSEQAAKEQIEKLEDRVRKLEDKLQRLLAQNA